MIHVVPYIRPSADNATLSAFAKQALQRNAPGGNSLASLVRLFDDRLTNELSALREAGSLCRHFSYSFLVVCMDDVCVELMSESTVHVHWTDTIRSGIKGLVVSGTLQEWKQTIVECSVDRVSFDLRTMMNQFKTFLVEEGYGQLFSDYKTKRHKDGTLLLEEK